MTDDNVRWQLALKAAIDRIGAAIFLLVLLPTLALLAALVYIGPGDGRDRRGKRDRRVLFRQRRVGEGGREFVLLKFRTMHGDPAQEGEADAVWAAAAAAGSVATYGCVDRRTAIGRVLRRLRLDELPQLVNVLRGQMSLVGPRPLPLRDHAMLDDWHKARYLVLPGMTGLWQISGRSGLEFDDLVRLDFTYIENWSIWSDVSIIVRTIPAVLSGRGAY